MKLTVVNDKPFEVPWGLKDVVIIFAMYLVLTSFLIFLPGLDESHVFNLLSALSLIVLPIGYLRLFRKAPVATLGIRLERWHRHALLGIVIALMVFPFTVILGPTPDMVYSSLSSLNFGRFLAAGFAVVAHFNLLLVLKPLFEELFFRSIMYSALRKKYSAAGSTIICSFVFMVPHIRYGGDILSVEYLGIFLYGGAVLSLAYERYRSLVLNTAVHATHNFLVYLLNYLVFLK